MSSTKYARWTESESSMVSNLALLYFIERKAPSKMRALQLAEAELLPKEKRRAYALSVSSYGRTYRQMNQFLDTHNGATHDQLCRILRKRLLASGWTDATVGTPLDRATADAVLEKTARIQELTNEVTALREENASLKEELTTVKFERDGLNARLELLKTASAVASEPKSSLPAPDLNSPVRILLIGVYERQLSALSDMLGSVRHKVVMRCLVNANDFAGLSLTDNMYIVDNKYFNGVRLKVPNHLIESPRYIRATGGLYSVAHQIKRQIFQTHS